MIVTGRARWIILLCVLAAVIGLLRQHVFLVRVAVAILIWMGMEWVAFRYRADLYLSKATIGRVLSDRQGAARVLWATRTATVTTKFSHPGGLLPRLSLLPPIRATVHDLLPTGVELVEGDNGHQFSLGQDASVELSFKIRPTAPGLVKFNGMRFVLEDLHGFFLAERFKYVPRELKVMPLAMELGSVSAVRKRANVLPPPGVHTVGRAGLGSELMEIREYQPGDSPKSIAWKVSARRDELMSKQFESEVPVRCQLLVDMSRSVRLGYPGPCLGGRLVNIASTIVFTLTAQRDPVGVSMVDGKQVRIMQSSASRKASLRVVDTLCSALHEPIPPLEIPSKPLIRSGYDIARIRYPEAMYYAERSLSSWWPARSMTRIRRRLAAALSNHYQLDRFSMGELEADDRVMSYWLQRFHTDHGAPYTGDLYDAKGNYLFDDCEKVVQLSQLLRRYAARGRDNELFVILAELTDTEYDLAPLVEAIKYSKARHHRVAVALAWPVGMSNPDSGHRNLKLETALATINPSDGDLLQHRTQQQSGYDRLRGELGRLGVPVVAMAEETASMMVLNQLEIIRAGRTVA